MEPSPPLPPSPPQHYSSFSWWWDSYSHSAHSRWFNSSAEEVDEKIKRIITLIEEENGETLADNRPKLIKMLQELHGSYRLLADKYDLLKSESSVKASNTGDTANFNSQTTEESSETSSCDFFLSSGKTNTIDASGPLRRTAAERGWHKKFSKLLEENLSNQAELIRRNEEKREMINGLISESQKKQNSIKMKEKLSQSQGRKSRSLFCFTC